MYGQPPDVRAGRLLDYGQCVLLDRTPVEASSKVGALMVALEKIVYANLIFEVNPFVPLDSSSLHGYGLRVYRLVQMRHKLWASLKKSENHDTRVGFVIEEYERSVKEGAAHRLPQLSLPGYL